jgi:hypothetical protein
VRAAQLQVLEAEAQQGDGLQRLAEAHFLHTRGGTGHGRRRGSKCGGTRSGAGKSGGRTEAWGWEQLCRVGAEAEARPRADGAFHVRCGRRSATPERTWPSRADGRPPQTLASGRVISTAEQRVCELGAPFNVGTSSHCASTTPRPPMRRCPDKPPRPSLRGLPASLRVLQAFHVFPRPFSQRAPLSPADKGTKNGNERGAAFSRHSRLRGCR